MAYKFKYGITELLIPKVTETLLYKYDLGSNVNLNNLTQEGYYHQASNANTSISLNYPINEAGLLTVINRRYIYQTYHSFCSSGYWYRSQYNGTWYSWRKVSDGGNADTVDGYHVGTYNTFNQSIVTRHPSGYIYSNYYNQSSSIENGTITNIIYDNGDGFHRKASKAHLLNQIDSGWVSVVYGYGISTYSGYAAVRVRKFGKVVQLQGYLTNSTTWTLHESIITIPYGYRPVTMCSGVMQGSMSNRFQLQIGGDGVGRADRYSNNTTTSNTVPIGTWLCINMLWITDQ